MAGLAEMLLGRENPFAQWTSSNQNYLGALAAGIGSGQNIQSGLSNGLQMVPQAKQMDLEARRQAEADAKVLAQTNATTAWLEQNHPDLAQMVQAGMPVGEAWNLATRRMMPQGGGDPFTLSPGQTRYGPNGEILAAADPEVAAPEVETIYDEQGRETKVQWDGTKYVPIGGSKAPSAPLVTVNTGSNSNAFYEAADKAGGQAFVDMELSGYQAGTKLAQIGRLEQLLVNSPSGFEAGAKQFAGEFGIATDGLSDLQAAQALINKLVPEQRPPGTGPMSDADLALYKESLPRLINQPGGNQLIIETLKGIALYEQQAGEIAIKVNNREMTPAEGRAALYALQNPIEPFKAAIGNAPASGAPPAGAVGDGWKLIGVE